jgi:hypothetical protein
VISHDSGGEGKRDQYKCSIENNQVEKEADAGAQCVCVCVCAQSCEFDISRVMKRRVIPSGNECICDKSDV